VPKDGTFLTSMGQMPAKAKSNKNESAQAEEQERREILSRLTNGTMDVTDIEIHKAEYSDDDTEIHFQEAELIKYLEKIEDNNLREILLWQDAEKELNELKERSDERIKSMQAQLAKREQEISDQQETLHFQKQKADSKRVQNVFVPTPGESKAFTEYLQSLLKNNPNGKQMITQINTKIKKILDLACIKYEDVTNFVEPMSRLDYNMKHQFDEYRRNDSLFPPDKEQEPRIMQKCCKDEKHQLYQLLKICDERRKEDRNAEKKLQEQEAEN